MLLPAQTQAYEFKFRERPFLKGIPDTLLVSVCIHVIYTHTQSTHKHTMLHTHSKHGYTIFTHTHIPHTHICIYTYTTHIP